MKTKALLKYSIYLLLIGMAFLALLPYMPPYFYVNRDSGIFLYGGQEIVSGKTLYVDFWDHKGPLLFYLNALGILLGQRTGLWFVQLFSLSVAVVASYIFTRKFFSARLSIFATFAWLYSFVVMIGGGNFSEEFSLPINFISIVLFDQYIKKQKNFLLVLLGLLIGLNIFLRPNNIGIQLVIISIILVKDIFNGGVAKFFKNTLLVFSGVALIFIPVSLFFYSQNAFDQFIDAVFLFNFRYANDPGFVKFSSLPLFVLTLGWPCWFALVGWVIVLADFLRKQQNLPVHVALLFLIGLPLEFLNASWAGRPYPHYILIVLPYLGLLNAVFWGRLIQFLRESKNKNLRLVLPAICVLAVFLSIGISMEFVETVNAVNPDLTENAEIVQFIKARTTRADTVLVWGQLPAINFLAERESPTKFAHQTFFFIAGVSNPTMGSTFLADLEKHKPALIIITSELPFTETFDSAFDEQLKPFLPDQRNMLRAFSEYVKENYVEIEPIQPWKLYKLRY